MKFFAIRVPGRVSAPLVMALMLGAGAPVQAFVGPNAVPPTYLGQQDLTRFSQPERVLVAQSQNEAQTALRIQQLEDQLRTLNGQVEGLTFQLTQMQTLLERLRQDNEARFEALEGGAGGKTEAATQSEGVAADGALPQDPNNVPLTQIPEQGVVPLPGEVEFDPTFTDGSMPMDDIGNSADPLVGTGLSGGTDLGTGAPLDLNYNPSAVSTDNADADAQYQAGYEALLQGDYLSAEEQLSQFIELYPDNAQYSDAANWLGEALIQREAYDEAADVLLTAFQKKPDSPRAPDLLLRLGISLSGAGERDTACRTLAEINNRYSDLTPAFTQRLASEQANAQCPPG